MATPHLPPGFDFTDPDIYAHRLPVQELAELRRTAPIWWNEQQPDQGGFGDGGYWVVSKHRDIREVSRRSAGEAAAEGSGDFVRQVACELPLQAIAGLLGVPPEDRGQLFDWSNNMIGSDDPEFAHYDALTSAGELMWYAMQLASRKAREPGDDIVTTLVKADAEG